VKYDDLADAVARIEATNGDPSIIWASNDMAAAHRAEKFATAYGSSGLRPGMPESLRPLAA
jgi:hypothetical protein